MKSKLSFLPPKGTKDADPNEMTLKESIFKNIVHVFKLHGAVPIETPIIEQREILLNKYGEESKLIYNLSEDDTSQNLSLRYDLTVPFARYMSKNRLQTLKRYQIGKVFRRDNPSISTGRFREFYQC
ncbi:MAG: hypothetical protein MHPSP_002150, partial [Paramarteilia canceri]